MCPIEISPPSIHVLAHSLKATCRREGLSLLLLPAFVREHGFMGLEVSDRQLAGQPDGALERFSRECAASGCRLILDINVDFTAADSNILGREIMHAQAMMRLAARIGAQTMRICLGGQALSIQKLFRRGREQAPADGAMIEQPPRQGAAAIRLEKWIMRLGHLYRSSRPARLPEQEEKRRRAVESLRQVLGEAARLDIRIGIENHWGISGDPADIVYIVEEVASPFLGTCPDLGNFPRGIDPLEGLITLAPRALILHAKSYAFRRDGEERNIAYARCLSLFRESGFSGPITVEYEGLGDDLTGCLLTRDLVLRSWPASRAS